MLGHMMMAMEKQNAEILKNKEIFTRMELFHDSLSRRLSAVVNALVDPSYLPATTIQSAARPVRDEEQVEEEEESEEVPVIRVPLVKLGSHDVVKTVHDVWNEWHHPWDGHLSIKNLNETYKDKWREKTPGAKKLYSRRKAVVDLVTEEIELRKNGDASKVIDVDEVLEYFENDRGQKAIATWIDGRRKKQKTT